MRDVRGRLGVVRRSVWLYQVCRAWVTPPRGSQEPTVSIERQRLWPWLHLVTEAVGVDKMAQENLKGKEKRSASKRCP